MSHYVVARSRYIYTPGLNKLWKRTKLPRTSTICVSSRMAILGVISIMISGASADIGGEFTNNLFSDLAPILALFGEQVAKQFLSESTGWADNILFAMAPLGIITAIVSAIRVADFPWLRAVIGRSKEGQGLVELELMSSNSRDVGEMWNGQAVVRLVGEPTIFQFIYESNPAADDPYRGIHILEKTNPLFELVHRTNQSGSPYELQRLPNNGTTSVGNPDASPPAPDLSWDEYYSNDWDEYYTHENRSGQNQSHPDESLLSHNILIPPNISLNARGIPVSDMEKWVCASLGVLVQLVVLLYEAAITYYSPLKSKSIFLKDGISASPEAFPCTAVGTIALNLGMLICAHIVDRSSIEEHWKIKKKKEDKDCKIVWIQKGGTVNDQVFEPYIIHGHEGQRKIITSRRYDIKPPTSLQYLVLVATAISVVGFIFQFIGLRGMTWSASIAQLAATLVMTFIRSVIRRRLTREPHAEPAIKEFELECMGRQMVGFSDWSIVSRSYGMTDVSWDDGPEPEGDSEGDPVPEGDHDPERGSAPAEAYREHARMHTRTPEPNSSIHDQDSCEMLRICGRLSALSQWQTQGAIFSRSLCEAIERTMNILFEPNECSLKLNAARLLKFSWKEMIRIGIKEEKHLGALTFKLHRNDLFSRWEMKDDTKTELMHVLSLWMLHDKEREDRFLQQWRSRSHDHDVDSELNNLNSNDRIVKVICPFSPVQHEWIQYWTGQGGTELRIGYPKILLETEHISPHRLLGCSHVFRGYEESIIAILTKKPMAQNLAMEMYSHFFASAVQLIDKIGGIGQEHMHGLRPEQPDNSTISNVIECIRIMGLGTTLDALLGKFICDNNTCFRV